MSAGIPAVTTDTAARVLAVLYVFGGEHEEMTLNVKFTQEVKYIQKQFHIEGGEVPDETFVLTLQHYVKELEKQNEPPEWAVNLGHGGMDAFVFGAFAEHLVKGEEMPIDVYDAAAWMVVTYLSALSVKENRIVDVPDFTNGAYKKRPIKDVVEFPTIRKR